MPASMEGVQVLRTGVDVVEMAWQQKSMTDVASVAALRARDPRSGVLPLGGVCAKEYGRCCISGGFARPRSAKWSAAVRRRLC